jgi:hypothetical protein
MSARCGCTRIVQELLRQLIVPKSGCVRYVKSSDVSREYSPENILGKGEYSENLLGKREYSRIFFFKNYYKRIIFLCFKFSKKSYKSYISVSQL